MNVFEFAMQMEKDGEAYYRELADSANNDGLSRILNFLADEEVKHYNIFKRMAGGKVEALPKSTLLADVKNIFVEMKDRGEKFDFDVEKQVAYYRKAQDLEKKSENLYADKAKESTDEKERDILIQIAEEEKRHYFVLENIIEFVNKPDRWLEDAEWNHLEDY
ncbi:ferritin family protein [bacterium]|nr:ferritin family protein [bacterium]